MLSISASPMSFKDKYATKTCQIYNGKDSDAAQQGFTWAVADKDLPRLPIFDGYSTTLHTTIKGKDGDFTFKLSSNWKNGSGTQLEMNSVASDGKSTLPFAQFKVVIQSKTQGKIVTSTYWMSTNTYCQAADVQVPFKWQDFQNVVLYQKIPKV